MARKKLKNQKEISKRKRERRKADETPSFVVVAVQVKPVCK